MRSSTVVVAFLFSVISASTALAPRATWPDTPFTVSGRDILGASGTKIKLAGVNWPGAADTMLPEGLQYASADSIASMIKSLGMNVVRLTFAIEMVDDYYVDSPHQTLQNTLIKALGSDNGMKVLNQILIHNPEFTANTTRLEVFDAVAAALAKQQLGLHLDNHISRAQWCCGGNDGNTWWGDTDFVPSNWTRGLVFMADRARSWEGFMSIGLRNELRQPPSGSSAQSYTWNTWKTNMLQAADQIYSINPSPLIYFSGLGYDTDLSGVIRGDNTFIARPYKNKTVLEIHNYANSATSCNSIKGSLYNNAYCAMNSTDTNCPNQFPVVMTEFGYNQEDGSNEGIYAQCIKSTILSQPGYSGSWIQWTLGGSYYIRQGVQDSDDSWGLTNHDWSGWRNQTVIDSYVKPFVQSTLASSA